MSIIGLTLDLQDITGTMEDIGIGDITTPSGVMDIPLMFPSICLA